MVRLRSLLSVALLASLGVFLPATSASAGPLSFLDPSRFFADHDDSHQVVLTSNEGGEIQPVPQPIPANQAGNGMAVGQPAQETYFAPPGSVTQWVGSDGGYCQQPDPFRDGWYLGLSGGTEYREQVHEIPDNTTFIDFDMGFNANVFLGYRFHRFRLEAEGSYMNNEVKTAGSGGLVSNATGNISMKALMFNGYYDFRILDWKLSPYLGAGIGAYQSSINSMYPAFFPIVGGNFTNSPVNCTSDVPLAWQVMAGLSYPLGDRTEAFAGYRYFRGDTLTFSSIPFTAPAAPFFQPNGAICHNVEFGLRIKF